MIYITICKVLAFLAAHFLMPGDTILALGDSYTIGEGVEEKHRWPVMLVTELNKVETLFERPTIVAKTGWTTDELKKGIEQHQLDNKYDWVTLLIGVNNQYRGKAIDEYRTQFRELLEFAIEKADHNPSRVIVLSIPDWGVTPFALKRNRDPKIIASQIDQFNDVKREETFKQKANYIDITDLTRKAADEPQTYLVKDELHPSAAMYQQWATRAAKVVREVRAKETRAK